MTKMKIDHRSILEEFYDVTQKGTLRLNINKAMKDVRFRDSIESLFGANLAQQIMKEIHKEASE